MYANRGMQTRRNNTRIKNRAKLARVKGQIKNRAKLRKNVNQMSAESYHVVLEVITLWVEVITLYQKAAKSGQAGQRLRVWGCPTITGLRRPI